MIEFLGFAYGLAKDLKDYLTWDEEEKRVDHEWLAKSGFGAKCEAEGFVLRWSPPDKVPSRQLDDYEYMYEVDNLKRKRRRIVWNDVVLLGKRR